MTSHNHTRSDRRPDGRGAGLRTALAIGAAVAVTWVTACPAGAAPSQYGPPQSNWESAVAYSVAAPEALPPGMNDLGCRPGLAHPRPLILINGALLNAYANWAIERLWRAGRVSTLPGGPQALGAVLPAARDGAAGSAFIREVFRDGPTRPGVRYVSITSDADLVVTPEEARFPEGPRVSNVVTQDSCPQDQVFHGSVIYDDISLRLVLNALDPQHATPPVCHPVLPLVN